MEWVGCIFQTKSIYLMTCVLQKLPLEICDYILTPALPVAGVNLQHPSQLSVSDQ
jgi:hypothetical protein